MALTEEFRRTVRNITKDCLEHIEKTGPEELFRAKRIAKYDNHLDFWHGYFVGTLVGQINEIYFRENEHDPTPEDHMEIEEIIAEYEKQLVEAVKKTE